MNRWKRNTSKSGNFSTRIVWNFYQGNNKNTNTLLTTIMGHIASHIMKRSQNTQKIMYQGKTEENWWFWNKDMKFVPISSHLFPISDNLPLERLLDVTTNILWMHLLDLNIIARDKSKKWDIFETTMSPTYFNFRSEILEQI